MGLVIITNIYNVFRVSLFHSDESSSRVSTSTTDETFDVYACTRSAFFK